MKIDEKRSLTNGLYDITGMGDAFYVTEDPVDEEITEEGLVDFLRIYPDYSYFSSEKTGETLFLSRNPDRIDEEEEDKGIFHDGSISIIRNCPKDILILLDE